MENRRHFTRLHLLLQPTRNEFGTHGHERFRLHPRTAVHPAAGPGGGHGYSSGWCQRRPEGVPDAPIFDGGKAEELRTWIIQLRNKLAAQPHRYPDDQACLRYAVNRLSGAALCLIRGYVSENTGRIRLESLNAHLDLLRQAFDDPDRTRTANREI